MIIINIIGGLGNQLFQYATAKRLALKHNVELKMDTNFENDKLRDFKLQFFNISEKIAKKEEVDKLILSFKIYNKIHHKIYRKLQLLKPYYKRKYYKYKLWSNDIGVLKASKNVYLDGYWGNELFFNDIRRQLLKTFTIKKEYITKDFTYLKNEIAKQNSISIHIRRGDYAENKYNLNFFGLMPVEYYQKAINYVTEKFSKNVFYVFSDDIDYVKQNFNFNTKVVYIENKNLQDYHELKLMSFCKHNIIANSTFSWWAAWLNKNPSKTVIAPKNWYNNTNAQEFYEKHSFVPETWIKL
ncbi:MAG: alpha-1,2-fucosyltransferase [Chlorobi bacterium]|nr:alpha-1,2-fucosyltransferase [Chlorobiota bacterium]